MRLVFCYQISLWIFIRDNYSKLSCKQHESLKKCQMFSDSRNYRDWTKGVDGILYPWCRICLRVLHVIMTSYSFSSQHLGWRLWLETKSHNRKETSDVTFIKIITRSKYKRYKVYQDSLTKFRRGRSGSRLYNRNPK